MNHKVSEIYFITDCYLLNPVIDAHSLPLKISLILYILVQNLIFLILTHNSVENV